jgi:hypothetical protein
MAYLTISQVHSQTVFRPKSPETPLRDIAKHFLTSLTAVDVRYLDCTISQTNNHILYTSYCMLSALVDPKSSVKNNHLQLEAILGWKLQLSAGVQRQEY